MSFYFYFLLVQKRNRYIIHFTAIGNTHHTTIDFGNRIRKHFSCVSGSKRAFFVISATKPRSLHRRGFALLRH